MTPIRVQRKRTKGWRMPENTVYVGRPTVHGNPFKVGEIYKMDAEGVIGCRTALAFMEGPPVFINDNAKAVEMFEEWTRRSLFTMAYIDELKGKNLACFCSLDKPCHADILLKLAND